MIMQVQEGTYQVSVSCGNCGYLGSLNIPKGQKAPGRRKTVLHDADDCPNCGCNTLTAGIDRKPSL